MRIGLVELLLILLIASLTIGPSAALWVDRWMRRAQKTSAAAARRRAGEEQHRIHRLLRQAEKRFLGGQGGLAAGFLAQILNFRPKLGKRQRIIRQKQKTARLHEKNLH